MPEKVLRLPPVKFVVEVFRRYSDDQSGVLAGYIAYAAMLAGLPFLIFTITLAGVMIGETYSTEAVDALFAAVPMHVAQTLEPVLGEVIGQRREGILTVALLGTIYAASNGVDAIRIGLDRAYDVETPRSFIMNRIVAIIFVGLCFLAFGSLAVLIIFAPLAFSIIEQVTAVDIPASADVARYLVGAILLYAIFWLMHRLLPARQMRDMTVWPGITVSILIWGILASLMSVYLAYAPNYALTYGALSGVIVTLLFFYLTGVAIILGAQVNAVVNFGLGHREQI